MTKGTTRRYVERLYYIVQDQLDGSLMFYSGPLFASKQIAVGDQLVAAAWKSRDEAADCLHRHGLHREGWRILKLAMPDARQ